MIGSKVTAILMMNNGTVLSETPLQRMANISIPLVLLEFQYFFLDFRKLGGFRVFANQPTIVILTSYHFYVLLKIHGKLLKRLQT